MQVYIKLALKGFLPVDEYMSLKGNLSKHNGMDTLTSELNINDL